MTERPAVWRDHESDGNDKEGAATPELSIIIVNWNTYELVVDCIESLETTVRDCSYEILVCDNSQDQSGRAAWARKSFRSVTWIFNESNRGFAAGNNRALTAAQGNLILLLNPDCVALPGSVDAMHAHMRQDGSLGVLGCQLLNADGSRQTSGYRVYPSLIGALLDVTGLLFMWRRYSSLRPIRQPLREVAWVKGACLMIRRAAAFTVGPLDEEFFLYSEDADWCYRAQRVGWKVAILADAFMLHYGQQSAGMDKTASVVAYYDAYQRFILKHMGSGRFTWRVDLSLLLLRLAAAVRLVGSALLSLFRGDDFGKARAYLEYLAGAGGWRTR